MMFDIEIQNLAKMVVELSIEKKIKISTAESCTGGLISGALTEVPGASCVFTHGFVTYSNDAKVEMLKVKQKSLNEFGAVSSQVVKEMAYGALDKSNGDIALSVSGVAGPDGSELKPVGLVFIGLAIKGNPTVSHEYNFGPLERSQVRHNTIKEALELILAELKN